MATLNKVDSYNRNRSSSASSHDAPSAPPPAPVSRSHVPAPPGRSSPATASRGGVFVGIDGTEKEAFFGLMDEYFASRPQYKELFKGGAGAPAPAAATPRRSPVPAPPAAAPAPPARARGLGTATALYDFEGQDPNEDLTFKEGDSIVVLEHGECAAYWLGRVALTANPRRS